jgi:predicted transcriptional regulator
VSDEQTLNPVELATELTIAWLGNQNNRVQADDVPQFLRTMHATVTELAGGTSSTAEAPEEAAPAEEFTPAVTARKSLGSKDHIISLIDGKPYKTLKRHLLHEWSHARRVPPPLQSEAGLSDGRGELFAGSARHGEEDRAWAEGARREGRGWPPPPRCRRELRATSRSSPG